MQDHFEPNPRPFVRHRIPTSGLVFLALLLGGTANGAEQRTAVARRLPEKGLVAYLEYDGLRAHSKTWEGTAAGAILQRTSTGAMAAELSRQILDQLLKDAPDAKISGAELLAVLRDLGDEGFALAVYDRGEGSTYCVLVGKGLGRQDARRRLEKLSRDLSGGKDDPKPKPAVKHREREIFQEPLVLEIRDGDEPVKARQSLPGQVAGEVVPPVAPAAEEGAERKATPAPAPEPTQSFWFEGDDLFLVFSDSAPKGDEPAADQPVEKKAPPARRHEDDLNAVLDALDGKTRTASEHDGYIVALAEGKDLEGFEPDGLFFLELGGRNGLLKTVLEGVKEASPLGSITPIQGLTRPRGRSTHYDVTSVPPGPSPPQNLQPPGPDESNDRLPAPAPAPDASNDRLPAPAPSDESNDRLPSAAPAPDAARPQRIPSPTVERDAQPAPAPSKDKTKPEEASDEEKRVEKQEVAKEFDQVEFLGLRGVKRLIARWGFQGKGLLTVVRVEVPSPRQGLMSWLDQPSFRKDRLPPIPRGVSSFVVGSFDPARSYEAVVTQLNKSFDPEFAPLVEAAEKAVLDVTGLRLRQDLLAHVGPTWCTFDLAEGPRDLTKGLSRGQVLVVGLRDAKAFTKVLDTVAVQVNTYLRELETGGKKDEAGKQDVGPPILVLERLPAPERGYQLVSPAGLVVWLDEEIRPTVLLGKSHMIIAANPELARAVQAAESAPGLSWQPKGELARTLAGLPAELTSLSVTDAADSALPEAIAKLPAYVQLLANLIGSSTTEDDDAPAPLLFSLAGIPRPSGFRVRLDPAKLPKAAVVRAHLFPSALATVVDDRGLRWIGREAFPFASISGGVPIKPKFKIDLTQPMGSRLKLDFDIAGVKKN